jgi:hypothetical protein
MTDLWLVLIAAFGLAACTAATWSKCADEGSSCSIPNAQPAVIRYGFGAEDALQDPSNDFSVSYHYVEAPSVSCTDAQCGVPTGQMDNPSKRIGAAKKICEFQLRNPFYATGSVTHPSYMNYTTCSKWDSNLSNKTCDTSGKILYARFGTPMRLDSSAASNFAVGSSTTTGYIYRAVKGKFACNSAYFGNTLVDPSEASCALSSEEPVRSQKISQSPCANGGYNCTIPDRSQVTFTSMELDGESEFFLATSGKDVHCNTASYVTDNANNGPIFCKIYAGISLEFTKPFGHWVNVASCANCALDTELQWGVSKMSESSITSSFSASVTNTIMNSFTFGDWTTSYTVSTEVSTSVAHSMSSSVTKTMGSSCSASCGKTIAYSSGVVMWQWQMDMGQIRELGDEDPFTIYSCHFLCKTGYDANVAPKCPLGQCANTQCTSCKTTAHALAVPSLV